MPSLLATGTKIHAIQIGPRNADGTPNLAVGSSIAMPGSLIPDITPTFDLGQTTLEDSCIKITDTNPSMSLAMNFCSLVEHEFLELIGSGTSIVDGSGLVTGDITSSIGHIGTKLGGGSSCCGGGSVGSGFYLAVWECLTACDSSPVIAADNVTSVWNVTIYPNITAINLTTPPLGASRTALKTWGVTLELGNGEIGAGNWNALGFTTLGSDLSIDSVQAAYATGATVVQPPFGDLCGCGDGGVGYDSGADLVNLAA